MIDLGLLLMCCIGVLALLALAVMWRILTFDHPTDTDDDTKGRE
jgi:hypothetical protein